MTSALGEVGVVWRLERAIIDTGSDVSNERGSGRGLGPGRACDRRRK